MTPIEGTFSIVIAGGWNPSIFNPNWVKHHIYEDENVSMSLPLNDPTQPVRIESSTSYIFPSLNRLEIRPVEQKLENMDELQDQAIKILSTLEHTPVSAIGVNFSFLTEDPNPELLSVFSLDDSSLIDSNKYSLQGTEIKRTFRLEESQIILNLTLQSRPNGTAIAFNFHYDIINNETAIKFLSDFKHIFWKEHIRNFLDDIYSGDYFIEEEG